ncbi:MAG: hypothetical protein OXS35_03205 [Dehalococcoidia bacterium]|nr:hypothetical protein [Dehalococcoidia bacterium]
MDKLWYNQPNRVNHVRDEFTDWSRVDKIGRLHYAGPVSIDGLDGYHYKANRKAGAGLKDEWYIAFYGIRLVEIEEVEALPVQVLNPEAVKVVSVDSTDNNGPGFLSYKIARVERHDTTKEKTFEALAEAEFSRTISTKAGGSFKANEVGAEVTDQFRARVEARKSDAWKASDSLENSVEKEYEIFPYHSLEVTVQEGTPKFRQVLPTKGLLQCGIRIDIRNTNAQDFDTYEDLVQVWRGFKAGSEFYSAWFGGFGRGLQDEQIDAWRRPRLNLNLEIQGDRVRYSKTRYNHKAIPGKEEEAQKYVDAKLSAI